MGPHHSRRPASGQTEPPQIDWQEVLRKHDRWLRTVIYARLGQSQAVDEVMQEVALGALKQNSPIRDPEKVAPWLYRLAVLQSLLYRRKQGRRRKLKDGYAERVRPTEEDGRPNDPLQWLLADERRKLIRTALERVSARDKEILLLKYIEDWSYRQLADHLGVSTSAVEARLHRARQRLRRELVALDVIETKV